MYNSITTTKISEQVPKSSPPGVWVGFLFAGAFLFIEILFVAFELDERAVTGYLTVILIGGGLYWLACVYRIHKILYELTGKRYPYPPWEAALKHIIPFFNIYWILRWPRTLSDYLTRQGRVQIMSGSLIGLMLLLSMIVRLFDGAIGMTFVFGVTMYISHKLKAHVKAVKGITPDQLPPLPDPGMFQGSIQTSTGPAQGVAQNTRIG